MLKWILLPFKLALLALAFLVDLVLSIVTGGTLSLTESAWERCFATKSRDAAQSIRKDMQETYGGPHECKSVDPGEIPGLDPRFYDEMKRLFEAEGFRWIDDIEDVTLTATCPELRSFIRALLGADGRVVAGVYCAKQSRPFPWMRMFKGDPPLLRVYDLETEFNNGTFLCTTTATLAGRMDVHPSIHREFLPPATPLGEALRRHLSIVEKWTGENPDLAVVAMQSRADILNMQHRQHELKCAHRRGSNWMTRDELRRIGGPGLEKAADDVYDRWETDENPPRR